MKHHIRTALPDDVPLGAALRNFVRKEDGVVTALACFIIVMMVLVGGIGVDLMRNEMERVRVQNCSDRAVLAAADLDQQYDENIPYTPEGVARDYLEKCGVDGAAHNVTVAIDEGLNYRNVTVNTSNTTPTRFMRFMGVDALPLPTRSAAEERVGKVEISLVLDISGSMANNSKLQNLRDAAGVFIDTVIQPETQDRISLSLIPYSEHVNAGPALMGRLNVSQMHNYSHCIEFDNTDFDSPVLSRTKWYAQAQHFQWNLYSDGANDRSDTVCPRYSYERIVPFSQNATYLKNQINQYQPRAGTSIFIGMKWAVGLLDPDFKSITSSLAGADIVDDVFNNRPAAYDDNDTLKTVILMTDGQNSNSNRIRNRYYNFNNAVNHWTTEGEPASDVAHWNDYNLNWYLRRYVNWEDRSAFHYRKHTDLEGDQLLYNICDAAKANNMVIWTIGFEVQDHGADVMRNCASSPTHFFRVEGVEISEAFKAIARQINQLRLTQ